jgi:hypothetical protein
LVTGSSLCTRCRQREAWAAVIAVPSLREHNGVLATGTSADRLCRECYHAEQRTLAAEQRRAQHEHLASLTSADLAEIVGYLAHAVKDASDQEWREILATLREAEQLRGSPWPPEIRRYLLNDARDDREASA